jgi:hypothetical protein
VLARPKTSGVAPEPHVDVVLSVEGIVLDERPVGVDLAAEKPLRQRRPVVRQPRVPRAQHDRPVTAVLPIRLDETGRSEAAADDHERVSVTRRHVPRGR